MSDASNSLDWGRIVDSGVRAGPNRVFLLLREVAQHFHSETAFLLVPSSSKAGVLTIPEGWLYSEVPFGPTVQVPRSLEVVSQVRRNEIAIIGAGSETRTPEPFASLGIRSALLTAVGRRRQAVLVVCNSKERFGRGGFNVPYTKQDDDMALAIARGITLDGVGDFILERLKKPRAGQEKKLAELWLREKPQLLKTHRAWYVAYSRGERIALTQSLGELVAAIREKLGPPPRPACEFHEIVATPSRGRGPSPRLWPVRR